jgi:hypothetical protein
MATQDIFSIVSTTLNKNNQEDVNGLYNLSQTNKEMNTIVNFNTDYDVLKKIARFPNLCDAVCDSVNNAINACTNDIFVIDVKDATRIAFENTKYINSYLTKQDLIDINVKICSLFLDWDDISIPRKYRDRCIVESNILYNIIKRADNNYNVSLRLPFSVTNDNELREYEEYFNGWLNML